MEMELLKLLLLTGQLLLLLLVLAPSAAASSNSSYVNKYQCDWCPRHSTASLFRPHHSDNKEGSSSETSEASGYMEKLQLPDGFHVAAARAGFLGACYQLRCGDRSLCGDHVKVIVTTTTTEKRNGTAGFLLTSDAFAAMGIDQLDGGLLHNRVLQVDFRRIPCEYGKKNLAVRVEEEQRSRKKHLAVRLLYQGGLTDIAAVEVQQRGSSSWRSMARRRNKQQGVVVWRTAGVPAGGRLQLRLVVTAGSGGKWLRTALPADWRPGGVYDTGIQVTDVAMRTCTHSCRALSSPANDDLR